ncbi:hypothetical protein AUH73_00010 [archaeon 13_1_40CM_4_53_4]|nr:MAG: hypothetical protein AUI07_07170 [archaeon 13_2_20CM_2_53_6]OLC64500.1 MAG: hypothetical protein AUH73_00010 [archaeon 13_1_40CM_4_53_4]OLE59705.1 MAG: hypothetical protein AUG17_01510 [Crenarchaeota archaeon 13_1_20CM_2_53_14]
MVLPLTLAQKRSALCARFHRRLVVRSAILTISSSSEGFSAILGFESRILVTVSTHSFSGWDFF